MKFISSLALLASMAPMVTLAVDVCHDTWAHDDSLAQCSAALGFEDWGWSNGRYGMSGCSECSCPDCPTEPPTPSDPPTKAPTPDPIPLPVKCMGYGADVLGDPHIRTFDKVKYDCQGEGEFHILKSMDSDFEIQGRFQRFSQDERPTVTKSVVWQTGEGDPKTQVTVPNAPVDGSCMATVYVDDEERDVLVDGPGDPNVQVKYFKKKGVEGLIFYYHSSGFQLSVRARTTSDNGCVLLVKVCLPFDWEVTREQMVGLLGNPDGDYDNDWMDRSSTSVEIPTDKEDLATQPAYDYCVTNWCLRKASDSLFHYLSGESFDHFDKCGLGPDAKTAACVADPPKAVFEVCGDSNLECTVDGCAGGEDESKSYLDDDKGTKEEECGRVVFSENFDTPFAKNWGEIDQGTLNTKFLRLHKGSNKFSKDFKVPAKADMITVEFIFLEIGKWEGANAGKDWVHFFVWDTPLDLLGFDFDLNKDNLLEYHEGHNRGLTWERRAMTNLTDCGFGHKTDQMHKITINIPQNYFEDGTLRLSFLLSMTEDKDDECGGVDDFKMVAYGISCDIEEEMIQPVDVVIDPVTLPLICDQRVATIYGDPHILSFDGMSYDCQGEGEFILAKSDNMEMQGRFEKFGGDQLSVMTAIGVKERKSPNVQLELDPTPVNGECKISLQIGGSQFDPSSVYVTEDVIVQDLGDEAAIFYYPKTQLQVVIIIHKSNKFGCFLSAKICIPDNYDHGSNIVGLLGSPDGDPSNEWMKPDGNKVDYGGEMYFKNSYDYCTTNWCVSDSEKSVFTHSKGSPFVNGCNGNYENKGSEQCAKNPSSDLLDICGDNMACIIDGCGGDNSDAEKALAVKYGLIDRRFCGYEMVTQDFEDEDASLWGLIYPDHSIYQSFRLFYKQSNSFAFSLGGIPSCTEDMTIQFSMINFHGFKQLCPNNQNHCFKNQLAVTVGNSVSDLTTIMLDMFEVPNIPMEGCKDGIQWRRNAISADYHKVEINVPRSWYKNDEMIIQVKAYYGTDKLQQDGRYYDSIGNFGLGVDDLVMTAYASKCKDMKEFYRDTIGDSHSARRLASGYRFSSDPAPHPDEIGLHELSQMIVSDEPRRLSLDVVSDDCQCVCPPVSTGGGPTSGVITMPLYIGAHATTCEPNSESVGTVTMTPNHNGTVTVHYTVNPGFSIIETILYAGEEVLPGYTTGTLLGADEFPHTDDHASVTEFTYYDVDPLECDFYLAAQAKICGPFPPSPEPTQAPTTSPTVAPTRNPTATPIPPTDSPTSSPSAKPTDFPTYSPTAAPTSVPTDSPTALPTASTPDPTSSPTNQPSSPSTPTPRTPAPQPETPKPSPTPPSPTPGASGDPHVMDWSGTTYDFHGGCDLVLLHNPGFANGLGMDIHIRTEIDTWWSYIKTAVLRIGDDTFEVMGGEGLKYWVNGKAGKTSLKNGRTLEKTLAGKYKIRFRWMNANQHIFNVDLGDGESILFKTFKQFVRVNVNASNPEDFLGSSGLMGSFPGGVHYARDNSTVLDDVNVMGQEWQVLSDERKLFHNLAGPQHPAKCSMPTETETSRKRRLGEAGITLEDAERACARVDAANRNACIFDVLATNDKDMAGSY